MRRFLVTFADSHTEEVVADAVVVNTWAVSFHWHRERPSKAPNARPDTTVRDQEAFLIIAERLVESVREITAQ